MSGLRDGLDANYSFLKQAGEVCFDYRGRLMLGLRFYKHNP
jgi:hypothetical protein